MGEQLLWEPIDQRNGNRGALSGLGPTRHPTPPIRSIRSAFTNVGRKGQDIANDYIIKLEVSAFRFHFNYAYVLRYLVTSDGVKGTTYTCAQKQSLESAEEGSE